MARWKEVQINLTAGSEIIRIRSREFFLYLISGIIIRIVIIISLDCCIYGIKLGLRAVRVLLSQEGRAREMRGIGNTKLS